MAMLETVTKINRILEGLIGCSLEFLPTETLAPEDWDRSELDLLRSDSDERPEYLQNETLDNCFGFPLNYRGSFAGLAVVKNLKSAKVRDLLRLAELITVALENGLEKEQSKINSEAVQAANVIPLRPGSDSLATFAALNEQVSTPIDPATPLKSLPLLIKVAEGFPLQRVAVEIHQLSNRWAMVGLSDLPSNILDSVEGLKELGAMTIFIPNLGALTSEKQEMLANYLEMGPTEEMPQIIAGLTAGDVLPSLMELFCVTELQWDSKDENEVTSELVKSSLRYILARTREKVMVDNRRYIPFHIQYLSPESFH